MNNRESKILSLINEDPMISNKEIAKRLDMSVISVMFYISKLSKRGKIIGRKYITRKSNYVCVIGGSNIDITGYPNGNFNQKDSNPGKVKTSLGGVARNIAENLSRLNVKVELITVLGTDSYARDIRSNCTENNINIMNSQLIPGFNTSVYVCINDKNGDMQCAISDMEIYSHITPRFIMSKLDIINSAIAVVIDTNIPQDTLEFIMSNVTVPIFMDTVSVKKAQKIKDIIKNIHTMKPNILEAEALSEMAIKNSQDLETAAKIIISKGVKNLYISMGKNGVFYADEFISGVIPGLPVNVVNTSGAGDTFLAATVWAYINNMDIIKSAKAGTAAASVCTSSNLNVSPDISPQRIKNILKSEWREI